MLVQIRDRAALSSLSIVSLRSYLNSRGWENEGPWGQRPATIYAKAHSGQNWEILVPVRDTIADYAESMAEAVSILASVEARSQLNVFYDLMGVGSDIIHMRPVNGWQRSPYRYARAQVCSTVRIICWLRLRAPWRNRKQPIGKRKLGGDGISRQCKTGAWVP